MPARIALACALTMLNAGVFAAELNIKDEKLAGQSLRIEIVWGGFAGMASNASIHKPIYTVSYAALGNFSVGEKPDPMTGKPACHFTAALFVERTLQVTSVPMGVTRPHPSLTRRDQLQASDEYPTFSESHDGRCEGINEKWDAAFQKLREAVPTKLKDFIRGEFGRLAGDIAKSFGEVQSMSARNGDDILKFGTDERAK